MRNVTAFLFLMIPLIMSAQNLRMGPSETGWAYNAQNQGQSVMPLLQASERQMRASDFEEAFFTLETAVSQNPNSAEALLVRARFKRTLGMIVEAKEDYDRAHRINPYVADLYGYNGSYGVQRLLASVPEDALLSLSPQHKFSYYHDAIDQYVLNNKIAENELASITLALYEFESNNIDVAASLLDRTIARDKTLAIAQDLRGLVHMREGELVQARNHFQEAIRLDRDYSIPWYNLGVIESGLGKHELAIINFDMALELQPNLTKAYFERAIANKAIGRYAEAIIDYDKVINIDGDMYIEAYVNRGLTKKMNGDFAGAFADLNQIITEYPDIPELHMNLGNLHLLFGSRNKALAAYSDVIAKTPNYKEAYYNRALGHLQFYNKVSGCEDLKTSRNLGYEKAGDLESAFCTF